MNPKQHPSPQEEVERYRIHNNDVNDPGYQQFVKPLVDKVRQNFDAHSIGLDFGSGTGPVASKMLRDIGFKISTYDPFFDNNPELLNRKYNYIIACEVVEHFHRPAKEFQLLERLLKSNSMLLLKTELFNDSIPFDTWYYKNDETHVIFYRPQTIKYIENTFGFSDSEINGRHIFLYKKSDY